MDLLDHGVDYYPRQQQFIYKHPAKTVVVFIVVASDAVLSRVGHKPAHSRSLVLQEGTSGCSLDISQVISSPHQSGSACDRWKGVSPFCSHSRNVQIYNWSFHLVDHIFQNAPLWWVD
jgi:hypothetical protein